MKVLLDKRSLHNRCMNMMYCMFEENNAALSDVGGKALSLIRLTGGGFDVPGGAVLTVEFFQNWIDELTADSDGRYYNADAFRTLALELKEKAKNLKYSQRQKEIIKSILTAIKCDGLYAVRSSSPEEDLQGASFAGGYETILGVNEKGIEDAVKRAFISCLDERVFFYKYQNGFDTALIRIAVIIQKQIDSEVSGVGFSLNPLNNCYDEAVINANIGLGESVVSGMVTPDETIVDKVSKEQLSYTIGSKSKTIVLKQDGGTKVVDDSSTTTKKALSDNQVDELRDLIVEVESFYGFPVDIEWAFSKGKLYLLQSRPITTYIPLPEEMQTKYGEQKILYLDGSLVKQGINVPMTVLGCDVLSLTQREMFMDIMGKDVCSDVKYGMATTRGGRMYVNVSSTARLQGVKRMAGSWDMVDNTTASMMRELDLSEYIPKKMPEPLKGAIWGTVKNNLSAISLFRKASKDPQGYKEWYQHYEDDFDHWLKSLDTSTVDVEDTTDEIIKRFVDLLGKMMPMTFAAEAARKAIAKLLEKTFDDGHERMQYMERALPDNVTIDMGLAMYELSQFEEVGLYDADTLIAKIERKELSDGFIDKWNNYMDKFGCRTTVELDVGVKRMSEKPCELIEQIKAMIDIEEDLNPVVIQRKAIAERENQYEQLRRELSSGDIKKLERHYNTLVALGGRREGLKYWYIRGLSAIRLLILAQADRLMNLGLLDDMQDIFWLNYNQMLNSNDANKSMIAKWIENNKVFYKKIETINNFPKFIDSRGKILTMPACEVKEGQIIGQPISPGVVTGRVKILHTPYEKELLPGEIMVTNATDPGWTPLFINASAIILEVGGLLQHGALVAREYGKPCIAGVLDVMNTLKDGQLIRVDATRGIIETVLEGDE